MKTKKTYTLTRNVYKRFEKMLAAGSTLYPKVEYRFPSKEVRPNRIKPVPDTLILEDNSFTLLLNDTKINHVVFDESCIKIDTHLYEYEIKEVD